MPIVIPLLLYNGEEEWKSAKDLSHLFKGVNLEFMKYIPNFNFEFYDFVREGRIIGNDELRMMINSFKYRLNPKRKDLFKTINFLYLNKHTINIFLRYIIITISEEYQEMVIKMLKEKIKEDDIMSIADALRREGIQIGEEKGLEKGKEEERLNLVKKMLLKGLDVATISELTNLSIEKVEEIKNSLTK